MANLQTNVPIKTLIEIKVEFPIYVLAEYNGAGNIDETWDDNIMYLINKSLLDNHIEIKKTTIDILPESKNSDERLSYHMLLVDYTTTFDFNWIIKSLTEENYQKGLCIKKKNGQDIFETIYSD